MRKHIVATASDDCTWKIFNLETSENIMTGEGHRDWIAGIDFHPAGSHLVTCGSDRCLKLWDLLIRELHILSKTLVMVPCGKLSSTTLVISS